MGLDFKAKRYKPNPAPFLTEVMTSGDMRQQVLWPANKILAAAKSIAAGHRDTGEYMDSIEVSTEIDGVWDPRWVAHVTATGPVDEDGFSLPVWMEMKHRIMWRAMLAAR